jgi:outer membrane lipoprotein LolB
MKLSAFNLRCVCLLGLALINGACVTQPQRVSGSSTAHSAAELHTWSANGKIGVSGTGQSGSGSFTWLQQADTSKLQVRGPVGTGSLQITLAGTQLSMQSSDGTQYNTEQVLTELENRLGVAVPVNQLRFWLLGVPGPGAFEWSEANTVLEQDGWHIVYGEWLQRGELRVPAKLTLTREQLRIVMVVQGWQLDS